MSPIAGQILPVRWRLSLVAILVGICLAVMVVKSFRLQVVHGEELRSLAEQQYSRNLKISASRGNIYDRQGRPLAISVPVWSVSAAPTNIEDPVFVAESLAPILEIKPELLERKLRGDRQFRWLKRRISPERAEQIREASLTGIGLHREAKRFYPNRELAGHLLGFVSIDGNGQQGIEKSFDDYLRGRTAVLTTLRDNKGGRVLLSQDMDIGLLEGDDVYVTLDARLQHVAEESLQQAVDKWNAKGGFAILMDPWTGEILALANNPIFNPNQVGRSSGLARKNQALSMVFEPGSTFKTITFAAALDTGTIEPEQLIFCENGRYKMGKFTIRDTHKDGWISASDVFRFSSNIGTLKISHKLGEKRFKEYVDLFGFGQRPEIGMVEAHKGRVPTNERWGSIRLGTASYGYGVMVSAMQLATALSAIANGGFRVEPRILSRIESPDGHRIKNGETQSKTRILKTSTTKKLTQIMKGVLQPGGTGTKASIPGIEAAGKTGTSEKIDPLTKRYSKDLHVSSFIGFAPADAPRYVGVVVIDEPKEVVFGGATAGPVWRDLTTAALVYDGTLKNEDLLGAAAAQNESPKRTASLQNKQQREPVRDEASVQGLDRQISEGAFDFTGMSAREAMAEAEALGFQVRFSGVGRVVAQKPLPHEQLKDNQVIHLVLEVKR
jgi:cell division protein FtsI (penicillin-binding protein 3)